MHTVSKFVLALIVACASSLRAETPAQIGTVLDRLAGTFSTAEQAGSDKRFFDVTLHAVPIWTERTDGAWLYFEESVSDAPATPYFQCVYQLLPADAGAVRLRKFALPDPLSLSGSWNDPVHRFASLTPAALKGSTECDIILRQQSDGSYAGVTEGRRCPSDLEGAAYMLTKIIVEPQVLIIWDRGFASNGQQTWGPRNGGYIFKKAASKLNS